MKPKEFDELIKQQFDRNDFAYNPKNWDQLAEKLDGNAKKRNIMMWWWVPLAGMAASVALALGVTTIMREGMPGSGAGVAHTIHGKVAQPGSVTDNAIYTPQIAENETNQPAGNDIYNNAVAANTHHRTADRNKHVAGRHTTRKGAHADTEDDDFGINLKNAIGNKVVFQSKKIDLTKEAAAPANKKKEVALVEPIATFKPAEEGVKKVPKISIILSGGYNHGNQNSGYMAGATIRRMLNDKVYIESDVAFASSNNTQSTAYVERQVTVPAASVGRKANTAKTASAEVNKTPKGPVNVVDVIGQKDINYDLYYAQVTPSIGYKVIKRMSIGLGPDFQQMLGDNRPAPSTVDRGTVQVAPLFDVGFIGKTEYAVTRKVKAAVYYRKGVNNVITPTDKYIDRDYLQFQIKYTIFNK